MIFDLNHNLSQESMTSLIVNDRVSTLNFYLSFKVICQNSINTLHHILKRKKLNFMKKLLEVLLLLYYSGESLFLGSLGHPLSFSPIRF